MSGNEPVNTLESGEHGPDPEVSNGSETGSVRAAPRDPFNEDVLYLGHWMGGLRSFLLKSGDGELASAGEDSELRLLRGALARVGEKTFDVAAHTASRRSADESTGLEVSSEEIAELADRIRDLLIQCDRLCAQEATDAGVAAAFRRSVFSVTDSEAAGAVVEAAARMSVEELPARVRELAGDAGIPVQWRLDLRQIVNRIGVLLGCLRLVGEMLERDEPLKSSLMLFARVEDLTNELTDYISARLDRFPDDSDALFASLDAAAYTTSIELKKVYGSELKGIVGIRPTPLVYARVETAYSLLNDSLQMTLANLVRLNGEDVLPTEIFPEVLRKERESVMLRERMWDVLRAVKKSEHGRDGFPAEQLVAELKRFKEEDLGFLFYKDRETVERFVEELSVTKDENEFGALVHRFGAYLETLFRQVNMRVVLSRHPFPMSPEDQRGSL